MFVYRIYELTNVSVANNNVANKQCIVFMNQHTQILVVS